MPFDSAATEKPEQHFVPSYFTRAELASLYRVGVQTIDNWTKLGKLPQPIRKGLKKLYPARPILDDLKKQEAATA